MKFSSCAYLLPLACSLLPSARAESYNGSLDSVSYTHLTLPTS